jgi:hypothetical protein
MAGSTETMELPLTAGQSRLFELLRENSARCPTICCCFRIPGELDIDRFINSIEILVARHEALRIEILDRPGRPPRQRIRGLPPRKDLLSCQNVLARSEEQFSRYLRHVAVQEQQRDWGAGAYPFRFRLFRYGTAVRVLMVALSHLAVDGIGAEVLVRDLMRIDADTLAGRPLRGPAGPGFAELVARQSAASGTSSRRFTERHPSGTPSLTRFDVASPSTAERAGRARQFYLSLAGPELSALREQASRHGGTEFTWILAAFARTVFQFIGQDRIEISVPVNLRNPAEREVAAMCVVPVPVVIDRPRDGDAGPSFVTGVGSALLRAIVRGRRSTAAGPGSRADLNILYQKMAGRDSREFVKWGTADYMPRVG